MKSNKDKVWEAIDRFEADEIGDTGLWLPLGNGYYLAWEIERNDHYERHFYNAYRLHAEVKHINCVFEPSDSNPHRSVYLGSTDLCLEFERDDLCTALNLIVGDMDSDDEDELESFRFKPLAS